MREIDTNVFVRFLVRDDEVQFKRARKLIKREVAAELPCIREPVSSSRNRMGSRYGLPKIEIIAAFSGLLDATDAQFEDEPAIEEALFVWKDNAVDFADCLIGAQNRSLGCRVTATFDVRASKLQVFSTA